jgi:hypothetical protein
MLDHSCQVQRHPHSERGVDLYETPVVAVEALLRVEKDLPQQIWEPAAGRGAIVRVLREHGHQVVASNLVDYGGLDFVQDFLTVVEAPTGCECILTNPSFRWAQEFVERALQLSPLVIMLARLAFLESERRTNILENCGLARIHVFRKRLPMLHRDNWQGRKANSGMAFCWIVWDRAHRGPATVHRISWEKQNPR